MNQETQELINQAVERWSELKAAQDLEQKGSGREYDSEFESKIGYLYWNNPELLFVLATGNEESYEGSQTQIGLTKDGKLKWEYQSHCSCNGYENSSGTGDDFPPTTAKSYELDSVPLDWEEKIKENLKKILTST